MHQCTATGNALWSPTEEMWRILDATTGRRIFAFERLPADVRSLMIPNQNEIRAIAEDGVIHQWKIDRPTHLPRVNAMNTVIPPLTCLALICTLATQLFAQNPLGDAQVKPAEIVADQIKNPVPVAKPVPDANPAFPRLRQMARTCLVRTSTRPLEKRNLTRHLSFKKRWQH